VTSFAGGEIWLDAELQSGKPVTNSGGAVRQHQFVDETETTKSAMIGSALNSPYTL